MYVKLDLSCLKGILVSHFHPADIDCIEDFRKLFSRFSPCCLPWPQFWFFLPLHPLSWNLKISALLTACLIWNTEWSHGGHKMEKKVEILPQVWDFELWIMNVSNEILDECCWRWLWSVDWGYQATTLRKCSVVHVIGLTEIWCAADKARPLLSHSNSNIHCQNLTISIFNMYNNND